MKNRATIKAQARELVRTGRISPVLVSAVVLVIANVLNELVSLLEYGVPTIAQFQQSMEYMTEYMLNNGDIYTVVEETAASSPVVTFVTVLVSLITTVLYAGYYSYCMGIRRREEMTFSSLLDGLGIVGKVIWCDILMSIKIVLWSMLFFIPGIIAAYRYRFAMYNMISDPSLSASQAIALSCKQTKGMKMDLFVLDLSFLGWQLLTALTFGILGIWTMPYITLSDLGYYEEAQIRMGVTPNGGNEPKHDTPWEF